ncbi:MAG: MFS transporter [Salinarimonas sp.]|nr:MFS transporter [Salinarimonas sp.]
MSARRELGAVLTATLTTQILVSWSVLALAAMAPVVAESVGLPAIVIGYQIAIVYAVGAGVSLLAGSLVTRFGGARVSQIALAACGAGCLVATFPGAPAIVIASIVIGAAHGMTNPSAAHLLARHTHKGNRGLIFSIKQTGVPLGGIAAGIITPAIAVAFGWQVALIAIVPVALVAVALLAPPRPAWDADRKPGTSLGIGALRGAGEAWQLPGLRWLCLCAFCFGGVQLCLMTFIVTFAVFDLGMSLVEAGMLLAVVQVSGVIGRVGWGVIADRLQRNGGVLVAIGLISAGAAVGFALVTTQTPPFVIYVLAVLFGASAVGWNGVFVSEIVRVSPPGLIGAASGLGTFGAFAGVLFAPPAFVQIHALTGSYSLTYGFLIIPSLIGALAALGTARPEALWR